MNVNYISRNVGIALVLNAAFMFLSVIVSLCYGMDEAFSPLFLSGVITVAAGSFPLIFVKTGGVVTLKEGFFTIVLTWLLVCVFGALPYILWGGEFSVVDAWFESVSGYTTTGCTSLRDVEALPKSLLFWRSSTHYMGGLGVVVFMILVLPNARSTFGLRLSAMEMGALSKQNYKFKVMETARIIILVYLGLTVVQTVCLVLAGVNFFDALNHSMSISATGGFSTKNNSAAAFNSPVVEIIMIVFMYLSGLHFGLIYVCFHTRSLRMFKDPVIKFYTLVLVGSIAITTFSLLSGGTEKNFLTALRHSAFMNVSAASTTGFSNAETMHWPVAALLLFFYLAFQGACSGSTTGGVKVDRICVSFSSLKARLRRNLHLNAVIRPRMGNRMLSGEIIGETNLYLVFFTSIIFFGAILLSATGLDLKTSVTTSLACTANTGLTFGSMSSFGNYESFPVVSKIIFTIEMFLGRLEIYPVLAFFVIKRWK
ncbi:MAG: TrkH family potassium uptake protein [Bacteroidales bacterium]|nr:TrkH family potassium uptake protein [Bacteroidales bacterium]